MSAAVPQAVRRGHVEGYASLFGRTDLAGDVVLPGAFRASLARRGTAALPMLWQHDPARPVGVWTRLVEDARGLRVEGRLALDTTGGREAAGLIAAGAVDGLSIGFRTRRSAPAPPGLPPAAVPARRLLAEIDLWEVSLVTFPMQEGARLTRRAAPDPPTGEALARHLRAAAARLAAPPPCQSRPGRARTRPAFWPSMDPKETT